MNGFAYSNKDVLTLKPDGKITPENVKQKTMFGKSQLTSVVNSAGEPFLSPVGQKVSVAKINIEASFTKTMSPHYLLTFQSQINAGDFSITYNGAVFVDLFSRNSCSFWLGCFTEVWTKISRGFRKKNIL